MLVTMLSLFLCGCMEKEQEWPGYNGTTEGYTYFYSEGRDRLWEEDILYFAENFLQGHPKLSDANFFIYIGGGDLTIDDAECEYSNELYDENVRSEFIALVNLLIPRISELDDLGIRYEALRMASLLDDAHSGVATSEGNVLPIRFELIGEESELQYCVVRTTQEHLLGSKLIAINDVPVAELLSRFAQYIPHENIYWLTRRIVGAYDHSYLTQKPALQAIGVVDSEAESVEIRFEAEAGILTETIDFISPRAYDEMELLTHDMVSPKTLSYSQSDNCWYTVVTDAENPYLYVRINSMDYEQTDFMNFYTAVSTQLRDSDVPLKLIIDFRHNSGGVYEPGVIASFANAVNRFQSNGPYILIDGRCFSAGMYTPYVLSELIDGAQLVGSPTGQFANCFGTYETFKTPNFEMWFYIADTYRRNLPGQDQDAIYPDVTVYQTWEDYQNKVDTVLEYVLALK